MRGNGLEPLDAQFLFTGSTLAAYVGMLRWLAYRLPYGDPLRATLPETLRMLRERLTDPGLLLDLGVTWGHDGNTVSTGVRETFGLPAPREAGTRRRACCRRARRSCWRRCGTARSGTPYGCGRRPCCRRRARTADPITRR